MKVIASAGLWILYMEEVVSVNPYSPFGCPFCPLQCAAIQMVRCRFSCLGIKEEVFVVQLQSIPSQQKEYSDSMITQIVKQTKHS
eukprot:3511066-Amphidinium_carterae.1